MPIPVPIAERDCPFARFARFSGAVSLKHALLMFRPYRLPLVSPLTLPFQPRVLVILHLQPHGSSLQCGRRKSHFRFDSLCRCSNFAYRLKQGDRDNQFREEEGETKKFLYIVYDTSLSERAAVCCLKRESIIFELTSSKQREGGSAEAGGRCIHLMHDAKSPQIKLRDFKYTGTVSRPRPRSGIRNVPY